MKRHSFARRINARRGLILNARQRRPWTDDFLAQTIRRRRPAFELLETRAMLTVAQDLVAEMTPYQSAISTALDNATSLTLVGNQLAGLAELDSILQNSLASIQTNTQGINTDGSYQISVPLPGLSKTFGFDLGLDAFLQATAVGSVQAAIHPTLNIGFDYVGGVVSLNSAQTNLDVGFDLSLPGFQGTFSFNGLLYAKAVDAGTNFHGDLMFSFDTSNGVSPHFSGDAHVLLGLSLSFVDPSLNASFNPTFRTTLDMHWAINPANNQLNSPSIQLVNFGLDADSFLDGFLGDVVKTVQKFTKPIQPFVDIFLEPVPIISAFGSSETIGTLILKGAGSSQAQQDSFKLMMQIINAVNFIDFSGSTGGAVIPFGTITLTGNAQQAGQFGFDTSQLGGAIDDILNTPALHDLKDDITAVANYAGLTASAGFKFPLLENPQSVVGGILLGQPDTTLFSFTTGRQHFELAPSIGIGIPDLFGIFLSAGIVFDANLTMGYDTAGLIALAQDPGHNPADLLHGFYFDNSIDTSVPPVPNTPPVRKTGLYLQGLMELSVDVVVVHASGGIYANLSVELVNTDTSPHVHLDTMINNLASGGKVFKLGGKVYASADISLELSLPVGPDITLFTYNLGYAELLNFDPPPPPIMTPPPVIHDVADQHTLLLDTSKMSAGSRVTVQPYYNLPLSIGGSVYETDGIRVDYPGETHLYVERKDDVFRDYYNLIAIDGTAPDRTSIDIVDPFRVFADEGAVNPYPAQTKPAVILAGGKDVNYKYREAFDGTRPNVLLVGGFGLNTLDGGTMEFGNFIPSSRVGQAHAFFGDTSGFDGAGQALIDAQIANAVSPANPAGVIGSTLYASRGGLMVGGPGNTSFYAQGAGAYEMVGGNWFNTFSISPSFNGVPATYQIDGGGGDSGLIVRVPADDDADFEGADVPDKYDPAYKALAIFNRQNARFALAHGIHRVQAIAAAGSNIVFGDTSELNIEFSIIGSAQVTFAGSPASDILDVTSQGGFNNRKNHFVVDSVIVASDGSIAGTMGYPFAGPSSYDIPVLTITRTFGTNGHTQSIPFSVDNPDASHITLDGRGGSDTNHIGLGLGSFLDITVNDSDVTTRNTLLTDFRDLNLGVVNTTLTDNSLQLQYHTLPAFLSILYLYGGTYYFYDPSLGGGLPTFGLFGASVFYSPTVFFSANVDVTLAAPRLYDNITINRPAAPNSAAIVLDGIGTSPPEYGGSLVTHPAYDADDIYAPPAPTIVIDATVAVIANGGNLTYQKPVAVMPTVFNVYSNAGTFNLSSAVTYGFYDTLNVLGNAGTIEVQYDLYSQYGPSGYIGLCHTVNIEGNTGIINLHDNVHAIGYGIEDQVNLGDSGSLANVHGTINFYNYAGHFGLSIDDRNNPGAPGAWIIDSDQTRIGDLTLNYQGVNAPAPYLDIFSKYQAFPKIGSAVTLIGAPRFHFIEYNGGSFPALNFGASTPSYQFNQDGDTVGLQLTATGDGGHTVVWAASNLPTGLSIDQTGLIGGTIQPQAGQNSPYATSVSITADGFTRVRVINWYVDSGITIGASLPYNLLGHEGMPVSLDPFTATNRYNLPVTFVASGLPPGIVFDANTAIISGTILVGAAQNGPYHVNIHATDGVETADYPFDWPVTGITLAAQQNRANHVGDAINFTISGSTYSGLPLTFAADSLPDGISIDPGTGVIAGIITAAAATQGNYYTTITATQGNDSASVAFSWAAVPAGVSSIVSIVNPGTQTSRRLDYVTTYVSATSSLNLPVSIDVTGLPPGLSLQQGEGSGIVGTIDAAAAINSPYHVTISATDGLASRQINFDWIVEPDSPIHAYNPGDSTSLVGQTIGFSIYVESTSPNPLTYSATGLPTGLSIDPQTGNISGTIAALSALPAAFYSKVTVTDGTSTSSTTFQWTILSSWDQNIVTLPNPTGGTIQLQSPFGTSLAASISPSSGVAPPIGIQFPWGFLSFTVSGVAAGAAADVTISGLDVAQITDYYKDGSTPANATPHWYDFLFGTPTDGDSAIGTGMEIVGSNLVLHLIDGGRGDDDSALNGVISDIGGPAVSQPAQPGDFDSDGDVDGADFVAWQTNFPKSSGATLAQGDADSDADVDGADFVVWQTNFPTTPSAGALGVENSDETLLGGDRSTSGSQTLTSPSEALFLADSTTSNPAAKTSRGRGSGSTAAPNVDAPALNFGGVALVGSGKSKSLHHISSILSQSRNKSDFEVASINNGIGVSIGNAPLSNDSAIKPLSRTRAAVATAATRHAALSPAAVDFWLQCSPTLHSRSSGRMLLAAAADLDAWHDFAAQNIVRTDRRASEVSSDFFGPGATV
ncbi:MAG: putative Ig domain-containing protein [Pirellulales bacterium]|nr:putative Ig domain-containing protein [Pirellulales bacterium]